MIMLKKAEARILVLLSQIGEEYRTPRMIAAKLRMDYPYVLQILANLRAQSWVQIEKYGIKSYYFLTKKAPLKEAKENLLEKG